MSRVLVIIVCVIFAILISLVDLKTTINSLTIELMSDQERSFRLYYDTGSGYNEQEAVDGEVLRRDKQATTYHFPIPHDKTLIAIRIDPDEQPSRYLIKTVSVNYLYNCKKIYPHRNWNAGQIEKMFVPLHNVKPFVLQQGNLLVETEGPDPHFGTKENLSKTWERLRNEQHPFLLPLKIVGYLILALVTILFFTHQYVPLRLKKKIYLCYQIKTSKVLFVCIISTFALFLGFFENYWKVADQQWFDNHQFDMESHVVGRMVKSRQDGIFSSAGQVGLGSLNSTPVSYNDQPFGNQYLAYINGLPFGAYCVYNSHIGGQGMFFSTLDRLITFTPEEKLVLFHALTSLLLAITLTAIILWFYLEFGLTVALFVLASVVFSQWLVVFGRNLYWSMWAFYLPMVVALYYLRFKKDLLKNIKPFKFGAIIFFITFIKIVFTGYEYITTTLIMMVVPFIYYGILKRLNFRQLLTVLITAAVSSCLAILLSFFILSFQIASATGHFQDGVNHIVSSFERRSMGNSEDFPTVYTPSLKASITYVVSQYMNGVFFNANNYLPSTNRFISEHLLKVKYKYLVLLFLIMSGMLHLFKNKSAAQDEKRIRFALIITTWFSILAPLSWFIIFKAHSYIHTHMNYIVWQMPFTFFGFAICGFVVKDVIRKRKRLAKRST